jgi:hypothetical protein
MQQKRRASGDCTTAIPDAQKAQVLDALAAQLIDEIGDWLAGPEGRFLAFYAARERECAG